MMRSVTTAAAAGLAAMLAFGPPASAADIRVLSTNALKTSLEALMPQFEKATEHKVVFVWGPAANLKTQIEKGEAFDATILTSAGIDDLVKQGKLDGATRTRLPVRASALQFAKAPRGPTSARRNPSSAHCSVPIRSPMSSRARAASI